MKNKKRQFVSPLRWALIPLLATQVMATQVERQHLNKSIEQVFFNHTSKKVETHSLLVATSKNILVERYAKGFQSKSIHMTWSMAKSFTSMAYFLAESRGLIQRDEFIYNILPQKFFSGPNLKWKKQIRVRHLLNMSSGIHFKENYEESPLDSDVINMLYLNGKKNMAQFALSRPQKYQPGEQFNYSSGDTNILMAVLRYKLQTKYNRFIDDLMKKQLGINHYVWEKDESGTHVGSSYLYLSPGSMIKVGQKILQSVNGQGRSFLRDWLVFASEPTTGKPKQKDRVKNFTYGNQVWLNLQVPQLNISREIATAPLNMVVLKGHEGQRLFILPDHDLVISRFAYDRPGQRPDYELFFKELELNTTGLPKTIGFNDNKGAR